MLFTVGSSTGTSPGVSADVHEQLTDAYPGAPRHLRPANARRSAYQNLSLAEFSTYLASENALQGSGATDLQ